MELMNVSISNIMTDKVAVLNPTDTIGFALLNMVRNRFTRIPIIEDNEIRGILSSADIISSIHEANSVDVLQEELSTIMTKEVVSGKIDDTLFEVILKMVENQVSCLPILDDGHLAGIFTNKDLLLFELFWRDLPEVEITKDTEGLQAFSEDMVISENDPVSKAIELIVTSKAKDLLMQNEEGGNIGIVPNHRLLRSLSTSLITEGMDMGYLDEKIVTRIVSEPLFSEDLPTTLDTCRETMNRRGVESVLLKQDSEYTSIINEANIRNLAFQEIKN